MHRLPRGCPAARRGELDDLAGDADTHATVATIALVAGAVLVAGAAVLYFTAPRPAKSASARLDRLPLGVSF